MTTLALPMSIDADVDIGTDEEGHKCALAMSMEEDNDNNEISSFKASSTEIVRRLKPIAAGIVDR